MDRTLPWCTRSDRAPRVSSMSQVGSGRWTWYRSIQSVLSRCRLDSTSRDDPAPRVPGHVRVGAHGRVHLGGQDHAVTPATGEGLGHDLLGLPAGVHVRGVDEVDPGVERGVDDADTVVVVGVPPGAEHHGSEAQRGHLHAGASQGAKVHLGPFAPWWRDAGSFDSATAVDEDGAR